MKKLAVTLCIVGTAVALSACESTETTEKTELAVPYTSERTASGEQPAAPAREERVFRSAQTK